MICTCGSDMETITQYVGDFWGAPAYEPCGSVCPECSLTDEDIMDVHVPADCDRSECDWCELVAEHELVG